MFTSIIQLKKTAKPRNNGTATVDSVSDRELVGEISSGNPSHPVMLTRTSSLFEELELV